MCISIAIYIIYIYIYTHILKKKYTHMHTDEYIYVVFPLCLIITLKSVRAQHHAFLQSFSVFLVCEQLVTKKFEVSFEG